ncbi:hypothetical protein CEUSTIGMA_g4037.t1 [Chlamydomonas eustigma]|uniref:Kinesin-like protein n=1 Tax=Chlamydomonas eustigma TaxID=1157962 RepID=A0A250X0J0_9CHLO|nr:hypothetical protein CEUSTIGMA_g4037.t1 [Chlamydomonas eustigma]|eukprot:GAX76591.1 hypothetical protein CEUSTIGMA_g4037.t1 [Chlamydomonas eustigma]
METLTNDKATLEVQLSTQQKLIANMREELGICKEHKAMAESQSESRGAHLLELKAQLEDAVLSLEAAERRMHDGELMRRRLHNTIQELKGNIRVFCRVRPMSSLEQVGADPDIQPALDFPPSDDLLSAGIILSAPSRDGAATLSKHVFAFDRVFTPEASQDAVFEEISELVQSALDGHKVCIFAYGQTGSGKTFTMLGSEEQPGMIPRSMRQIFESSQGLRQQGWELSLQASMLEIYNEEYKDLLSSKKLSGSNKSTKEGFGSQQPSGEIKKHQVVHNPDGSTTVSELTVVDITQASQVDLLLAQAMEKRSVGCTALNEQSSRSHMVFTLRLEGVNEAKGKRVSGVLNLIDLAGSERVKDSGAAGLRMKEAQAINTSLSALGDVIVALGNKQPHIPFRNSKLTYLLQPCLGGDAKTLMFVNVAPNIQFAGESLCSLRFAAKVNACEINHRKKG